MIALFHVADFPRCLGSLGCLLVGENEGQEGQWELWFMGGHWEALVRVNGDWALGLKHQDTETFLTLATTNDPCCSSLTVTFLYFHPPLPPLCFSPLCSFLSLLPRTWLRRLQLLLPAEVREGFGKVPLTNLCTDFELLSFFFSFSPPTLSAVSELNPLPGMARWGCCSPF